MNRALFIIFGVAAILIIKSVFVKPSSNVHISNVQGVPCLGGTYQAVMASRGGKVEQVVLTDSSRNITFSLAPAGQSYQVTYAVLGFGGESSLREVPVPSNVCVLDPERGVQKVTYSGSLADLETKIRKKESLSITVGY